MKIENASTPEAAPDAVAATESTEPKTMLDAISQGLDKSAAEGEKDTSKPAVKTDEEPAADDSEDSDEAADLPKDGKAKPKEDAKPDADKAKPKADKPKGEEEDDGEGMAEATAKRFQKMQTKHRELKSKYADSEATVTAFQEFLGEHKVGQEQFEQAVDIIGMINRQDFAGALKAIDAQRKTLVLLAGIEDKPVDPLDEYPQIKARMESMEIPRDVALKLARGEWIDEQTRRHQQAAQQQTQTQQGFDQAKQTALDQIDAFIAKQAKEDIDFGAKEKIVAEEVVGWLQGLPPAQWPTTVQRMYGLLGKVGAKANGGSRPLRPSGQGGGARPAPATLYEAMWNAPRA